MYPGSGRDGKGGTERRRARDAPRAPLTSHFPPLTGDGPPPGVFQLIGFVLAYRYRNQMDPSRGQSLE